MFARLVSFSTVSRAWESRFHVLRSRTYFRRYRGCPVSFSCFALPDMFSAVSSALGPVFMVCAPGLVFGGLEGDGSRFHVLRVGISFLRYRGRQVLFSYFARPDTFAAVPRASGPIFKYCAPGFIFGGTEGVRSRFNVLRSRTHFRRFQGRYVQGPLPGLIFDGPFFGGSEDVGSRFRRTRTSLRRFRGRRVTFLCFKLPESFPTVPRARVPFFIFLRSLTGFWRYRGRRVPFSCFARPDSFLAVWRASGLVFMFCAP
jgi:hypothetical protein